MKTFNPPIKERTTEDLIRIANSSEEEWQKEAIFQAKNELLVRNVSKKQQEDFFQNEFGSESENDEIYYKENRQRNLTESYSLITMIYIFIFTPLLLVRNWRIDLNLFELKEQSYLLKYKQRLITIIISIIVYAISIYLYVDYLDKKREEEINNIDITEWEKEFGYDK